jgi:hypothetical protein
MAPVSGSASDDTVAPSGPSAGGVADPAGARPGPDRAVVLGGAGNGLPDGGGGNAAFHRCIGDIPMSCGDGTDTPSTFGGTNPPDSGAGHLSSGAKGIPVVASRHRMCQSGRGRCA